MLSFAACIVTEPYVSFALVAKSLSVADKNVGDTSREAHMHTM